MRTPKTLDNIIFDALGLTEEERKEVYWAVAELVKKKQISESKECLRNGNYQSWYITE
ncbi:MAG: hypothetical protein QXY62_06360 [Candidatus Altiarchaeota archaeon]